MEPQDAMNRDLVLLDISTPERLAAVQELLRLAMDITCQGSAFAGAAADPSVPVEQGSSGDVACRTLRVDDGGGQLPDDETGVLRVGLQAQVDGVHCALRGGHHSHIASGPCVLGVGYCAQVAPELAVLPGGQVAQVADGLVYTRGAHGDQLADGRGVLRDGLGVSVPAHPGVVRGGPPAQVVHELGVLGNECGAHVAANGQSNPGTATVPFYPVEVPIPGTAPTGVGVPSNASTFALTPTWCCSADGATTSTGVAQANAFGAPPVTSQPLYDTLRQRNVDPSYGFGGVPSSLKRALKMIAPFNSDSFTVEEARAFWTDFERTTVGLDDPLRFIVFSNCLKGKTAEEWWLYSQIHDFETLRIRFHNQFACLTPQQILERLNTAKRSRGMSAEVWGDRISGLCDDAKCVDPLMRYQYFLSGLRNSTWEKLLRSTIVSSIQDAVVFLLYNNMHLPVENDADFVDEDTNEAMVESTKKYLSVENDADFAEKVMTESAAESATLMQMMGLLHQNQHLVAQQQLELSRGTHAVAVANENQSYRVQQSVPAWTSTRTLQEPFRGVRQEPDTYTLDGRVVCGRCRSLGCSRFRCWRADAICLNCQIRGHVAAECGVSDGRRGEGDEEERVQYRGDWKSSYAKGNTNQRSVQYPTKRTCQRTLEQSEQANVPALEPPLAQHGTQREWMDTSGAPSARQSHDTGWNAWNARTRPFDGNQSASELVGAVRSAPNYKNSTIGAVNETGTKNRRRSARRERSVRKERPATASGPVPWELLLNGTAVNAEWPVRTERSEHRERLLNAPLRMERAKERTMDTRLREGRGEQLLSAKASPDEEIASEPAAMMAPREEPTTTRTEPSRPPKGERDCVPQPEGEPYYYEPPLSWDQILERSSGPAQFAAVMKTEDPGVSENAVDEERTPGVPIAEPFMEEGPSVKSEEVAAVPIGEAPVEHEKTNTTTVSVCTGPKFRSRETLPVKNKNIHFGVPGVGSQDTVVPAGDIGAPALNKNLPYNKLTANEPVEPNDPNYPSDTTEFTPNLKILLHENAANEYVPRTLDEDATLTHGERVVAATAHSADPVANAYHDDPTTNLDETNTTEDDTGSPPPHARLTTPDGLNAFVRDAAPVVMKLKQNHGTELEEWCFPQDEAEPSKKMGENAAAKPSTPRIVMIQSDDSDERDVGGGAGVAKDPGISASAPRMSTIRYNSSDEQDVGGGAHDHGDVADCGGLVEVGEGSTFDSVAGTAVCRGGSAYTGTAPVCPGAIVQVGELHAPHEGADVSAPGDEVEFGAAEMPGQDEKGVRCCVVLPWNTAWDGMELVREERKNARWSSALLSLILLGMLAFLTHGWLHYGRQVSCLMMCSSAGA